MPASATSVHCRMHEPESSTMTDCCDNSISYFVVSCTLLVYRWDLACPLDPFEWFT